MPVTVRRRVELLHLAAPLRQYAQALQPDPNAASFLVHQALSAAFAEQPSPPRETGELETSLREDVDRNFALDGPDAPGHPQTQVIG